MARIFITGSSDGLGLMAGKRLADEGHRVTLHARNDARANDAKKKLPAAEHVVTGDVATLGGMRQVSERANATGPFDAVIHNVAIGYREPRRIETTDGIERVFAINALAPYVLTALIARPKRLVYLSSGLHRSGDADLRDPQWKKRGCAERALGGARPEKRHAHAGRRPLELHVVLDVVRSSSF